VRSNGYAVGQPRSHFVPVLRTDPSTWTDQRHINGLDAERLAAELLERCGYEVLAHRYRVHRHDIDLIARRGSIVVFVEVRWRASTRYGSPMETVTARKRLDLARAASAWLQRHGRPGDAARFDVVGVVGDRVEWLQSALDELTEIWLGAESRVRLAITSASHLIELQLSTNPYEESESRPGGRRIMFVSPLAVVYRIEHERSVIVLHVWRFGKRQS